MVVQKGSADTLSIQVNVLRRCYRPGIRLPPLRRQMKLSRAARTIAGLEAIAAP
jgi:hypothetical protein